MKRRYRQAFVLWLVLASATSVHAQGSAQNVIVTGDDVSTEVFEVLAGALEHDDLRLRRAADAPECAGAAAEAGIDAQVWLSWAEGSTARLCFQDRCRSVQRVLGPFAKLDARAREELITVIEAGIAALRASCSEAQPEAPPPAPPNTQERSAPIAPPAPLPESAAPSVHSAAPASAPLAISPVRVDQPPSAAGGPTLSGHDWRPVLAIGASYGVTRWTDAVYAQRFAATVGTAVHRRLIYVGLEFGYAPWLRAQRDRLALDGGSVHIAAVVWGRWSLSDLWSIHAQLGPGIEWLWLTPASGTMRLLSDARSAGHVDPMLYVRLGPALRVFASLRVGVDLQLDVAWMQRNFGFATNDGQRPVFEPDRVRMSLALNARAEL